MPVDVSEWTAIRPELGGKDARKVWLSRRPDDMREDWWLWKPRKPTGQNETRDNDVAEVVGYELARAIGLPAAECRYALRGGERGIISRNVAPHTHEMSLGSDWGAPEHYSVARVLGLLRNMKGPPPDHNSLTAAEVFTGFLVLDAWIGNTDRHEENWALLTPPNGPTYLAPSYDHGSALGSGMDERRRGAVDRRAFCERGRSRVFSKRSLVDIATEAVSITGATWWAERVADVSADLWTGILEDHGSLSVVSHTFVSDILTINQERVSRACRP